MFASRSRHTLAVVLVAVALAATACGTTTTQTVPSTQGRVDVVRLAGGSLGYPSPYAYNKGPGLAMANLSFDTLLWKDGSGQMIPWLATSWEQGAGGTEWRFTLRDGVMWHDGQPLTAEDVAFTFEYVTTGAGRTALGVIGQVPVKEAVVEGPGVVVLKLERPFAPFEDAVAGRVPIVPRHVWQGVEDPAKFRDPSALVGTGAYRLAAFDETAGTYQYVADEGFWGGPPHVKRIEFVPTTNELASLRRGELDAAWGFSGGGAVPDAAIAPFESDPRFGTIEAPGESNTALHFNLTAGAPYDDKAFRQAVAYAVDRTDMVKRLLLGRGEVGSTGNLAPSHPMVVPGLPTYARDVAKAGSLLDGIGIRDTNGDGLRDLPDGSTFRPELLVASGNIQPAELMKEYLRDVGLDLQITAVDQASHDSAAAAGNYRMALVGYGGMGGDPDWLRQRISARVQSRAFLRVHGYDNPDFESAAARQVVTTDPQERLALVHAMQRALAEDLPLLSLYLGTRMTIFNQTVFGAWYYTPGAVFGLYPHPLNKHSVITGKTTGW